MKVTVTTLDDKIFNFDVSEDLELENFKAFCEVESGVPSREILIHLNGRPLTDDKKSLKDLGVVENDVLIMQHQRTSQSQSGFGLGLNPASNPAAGAGGQPAAAPVLAQLDFSQIRVPRSSSSTRIQQQNNDPDDPAFIRDTLLASPHQMAQLKQNNPRLAEALESGNFELFSKMIREMQKARADREAQKLRLLSASAFDTEAQRLIAEEIRQKNIDANMEAAIEFNPESFGTVHMLYIDCKVNGVPVKAFIDSGAQTTIMSTECAERCNIMRLVDTRFSGIAKGVGVQKIIGRVHMGQIQIENDFLTSSFSILENQKMDMLLGLDMLKRHQCCIDLKRNVLVIGTTKTETVFLNESDLPEAARLTSTASESMLENEDALMQVGGEDIGLSKAIEESVKDQKRINDGQGNSSTGPNNTNTGSQSQVQDNFTEEIVQELILLGFPRDKVLNSLRKHNGDKTKATAFLFAEAFKF